MVLELKQSVLNHLSVETILRLKALEEWDLAGISERVRLRMSWPTERVKLIEHEYRKYISLIIIRPNQEYGMAGDVDEFWHEHIIDTRNYLQFCRHVVGTFIHHQPENRSLPIENGSRNAYRKYTIPHLKMHFQEFSKQVWLGDGQVDCGKSCSSCKDIRNSDALAFMSAPMQ